jgi:hypothetical protein
MTPEELQRVEELCKDATDAPWFITRDEEDGQKLRVRSKFSSGLDVAVIVPWMTHDEPNAAFIAESRELLPKLLSEVKRLKALVKI